MNWTDALYLKNLLGRDDGQDEQNKTEIPIT